LPGFSNANDGVNARAYCRIALRHKELQSLLYDLLTAEAGADNVAIEHPLELGVRVDAAVKQQSGFSFYEVKVAPSAQACLRAALGELLEYAYWPAASRADELVVVGEHTADPEDRSYLELLRSRFKLPIFYRQLNQESTSLAQKHRPFLPEIEPAAKATILRNRANSCRQTLLAKNVSALQRLKLRT
jgi:hypothetical protein